MRLELNQDGLCLKRSQLLSVCGGVGRTLVCHSGSVWVTQEGDQRDIILGAGEAFVLDHAGTALVQGLEQSAISFARSVPAAGAPGAWKSFGRAAQPALGA